MSKKVRDATGKPRVYKISLGGMWWVDVLIEGHVLFEFFNTHAEAMQQAYEYARMSKEATK